MDEVVFYTDWLALDKKCFRMLVMVTENGDFSGDLTDMCNRLSITAQTKNRKQLKAAIQELMDDGWIETEQMGRTYHLKVVPRGTEIHLPREWMEKIMLREYSAADVAWQQVLRVLLWLIDCGSEEIITDKMIASDLGISDSTVSAAKKVLREDYELLKVKVFAGKRPDGSFWRTGHQATINAWMKAE